MWGLAAAALAADPGPITPTFGARTFKVDLVGYAPALHPWGSDWKVSTLEQWSAVLACAPDGARRERCTFVDGVWWGTLVDGASEVALVKLPAPGEVAFSWNARGRLVAWDVLGDRSAFWTEASNAALQHSYHRSDVQFKPNAQREIGEKIEQSFVRWVASALEWELPKDGAGPEWKATQAPVIARRWTQSTASADVALAVTASDDRQATLRMWGTVGERVAESSVEDLAIQTEVMGTATFDKAAGTISAARTETVVRSATGPLTGHTRYVSIVRPWREGDPKAPLDPGAPTMP